MKNVMTWRQAVDNGYTERVAEYSYENIPVGSFRASLDFKIWAKKVMGINCFFTIKETGQKILLTAFCKEEGVYRIGRVDVTTCVVNRDYKISITLNQKEKVVFTDLHLVE